MRGLFYSVIEMNTKKKFSVGLSREKAVQKMIELAKENPKGDYRIAYKWGSIQATPTKEKEGLTICL